MKERVLTIQMDSLLMLQSKAKRVNPFHFL
jgi:hypothetical protein